MSKTKLPLMTTKEILTKAQQLTNTSIFPALVPSKQPVTVEKLKKQLEDHKASVDRLSVPFAIYQKNLAEATPQPVRWFWENRLPTAGITLLDGDHRCGKSLLTLQIAAAVSSGTTMPDGTPTIPGGVVIITPHTDANTTQLQLLSALGADLSRIEILTYIQQEAPEFNTGGYRLFSLPEDLPRLFNAIERVDARLVIFDPFISLLSREHRWTDQRLGYLLTDLNQRLIERDVACLLIRNCPAKGGHARPSLLERSDHFIITATCHTLLAPSPMQPEHLLLSQVNNRHTALTPTLKLQIQKQSGQKQPHITVLGAHDLQARDLIENRPDTLNRRLLSTDLLRIISESSRPIHVTTLYDRSPQSSPFQVHRALSDLLRTGQIQRSARGFYIKASTKTSSNAPAAITPDTEPTIVSNETAAITPEAEPTTILNGTATPTPETQSPDVFDGVAAITLNTESATIFNGTAAITPETELAASFNGTAATTFETQSEDIVNENTAITPEAEPTTISDGTAATTSEIQSIDIVNGTAAITPSLPVKTTGADNVPENLISVPT